MGMAPQNFKQQFLQNVLAGLTVSFVALSLGAAFGILSGRGAFAGMISAALIATVTALLGGTRVQCSGPTGPMTTVTAVLVAAVYSNIAIKFPGYNPEHIINITIFMMAGILVLFAIFRLGKYVSYVPTVVVSGFMNGIAIIIWLDQIKELFGLNGHTALEGHLNQNALLFVLSIALMFLIPRITRRYLAKFESLLSATLLTLILTTMGSYVFHLDVERIQLSASLKNMGDLSTLVATQWPTTFSLDIFIFALPFAFQLAFLCYLDTLLTSLVVDKMTGEVTRRDKELFAQGIAGGVAGLVGGIPGAQATIRSVLIVKERGTLRMAGILVGIFALVEMILFQDAINLIPKAVFAGILMKVGYDVFDWTPPRLYLKELFRHPVANLHHFFSRHDDEPIFVTNREMVIIIGTTLVTALWDLNIAVGIFTALFYLHNKVLNRKNPIRDLKPEIESEGFSDQI